jgi:hypothetical protein
MMTQAMSAPAHTDAALVAEILPPVHNSNVHRKKIRFFCRKTPLVVTIE